MTPQSEKSYGHSFLYGVFERISDDADIIADRQGNLEFANHAARTLFGSVAEGRIDPYGGKKA